MSKLKQDARKKEMVFNKKLKNTMISGILESLEKYRVFHLKHQNSTKNFRKKSRDEFEKLLRKKRKNKLMFSEL